MSTEIPQVGGYEDELAIATIFLSVPLLYLFGINRRAFPLAQREPSLVLVSSTALIFWIAFRLFQMVHPEIIRLVVQIADFVCLGLVLCLLVIRVWKVFMDAGLTHERAQGRIGWFIIHRNLASKRFYVRVAVLVNIFHLILFIIVTALEPGEVLEPAREPQDTPTSALILTGVAVVYSLIFLFLSFKLQGLNDGFYIKQELSAIGVGTFLCLLGWILQTTLDLPCSVINCGVLILWCGAVWMLGWSLFFPLFLAFFRDRRFKWYILPPIYSRSRRDSRSLQSRNSSVVSRPELPTPDSSPVKMTRTLSQHKLEKLRKIPLKKFLTATAAREAFRAFTVREFSVENLMFVEAVQVFKDKANVVKLDAMMLMNRYVIPGAPNQVNLPSVILKKMTARFEEATESRDLKILFDEASHYVMRLMERDAFRRFQATVEWQYHALEFDDNRPSLTELEMVRLPPVQVAPAAVVAPLVPATPTASASSSTDLAVPVDMTSAEGSSIDVADDARPIVLEVDEGASGSL